MRIKSYEEYIADLLDHPDIQRLRETRNHHWKRDRFSHCYAVGKLSYRLAVFFHANANIAARAGFLHDWYHGHMPERRHFVNADQHHFRISLQAASAYGEHPTVLHAIRTHFWPWGRMLPKTREAWIVWSADNLIWAVDLWQSAKIALRQRWSTGPAAQS
ncbi:MAG: HD domain-containing protein [Candidatus Kerfeldbacteria bacterium]|nr:HD domain-containing protein [Candidatus Kerfeldbacteria bacterium]